VSEIEVRPVRMRRERRVFLTFPWRIYRDDPLWVPPPMPERARTTDPRRGAFFQRGEAEFFVAWRDGEPVGTICAADEREINVAQGTRECTFGFFECVDDDRVAAALFRAAIDWARGRGLDTLYGPFHLDRENAYGILIEGRDRPSVIFCGHTPPYYVRFFEGGGWEKARGDNLAYAFDLDADSAALARLPRLADRVGSKRWTGCTTSWSAPWLTCPITSPGGATRCARCWLPLSSSPIPI